VLVVSLDALLNPLPRLVRNRRVGGCIDGRAAQVDVDVDDQAVAVNGPVAVRRLASDFGVGLVHA
jgi:hypothetical protein